MDLAASGWRLPDDACALLARLVADHRPELILECGSGRSTVVLAEAVSDWGGKVITLEHDAGFYRETRALVAARELTAWADVRLAPLEPQQDGLAPDWYASHAWHDVQGIGMLLVDGPPGGTSRFARHPAVPLLRERLLPGCLVVLDDVNREPEQAIWRDWGIQGTMFAHAKASLVYGTLA